MLILLHLTIQANTEIASFLFLIIFKDQKSDISFLEAQWLRSWCGFTA